MKYKHTGVEGWYCQIDDDGNKSASWSKKNRPVMYAEMQEWVEAGNTIEAQFTTEELAQKEADAVEAAKTAYIGLRASEYPSIGDQLDYIYHNGIVSWKANIIKPIKDKYPKP